MLVASPGPPALCHAPHLLAEEPPGWQLLLAPPPGWKLPRAPPSTMPCHSPAHRGAPSLADPLGTPQHCAAPLTCSLSLRCSAHASMMQLAACLAISSRKLLHRPRLQLFRWGYCGERPGTAHGSAPHTWHLPATDLKCQLLSFLPHGGGSRHPCPSSHALSCVSPACSSPMHLPSSPQVLPTCIIMHAHPPSHRGFSSPLYCPPCAPPPPCIPRMPPATVARTSSGHMGWVQWAKWLQTSGKAMVKRSMAGSSMVRANSFSKGRM